MTLASAKNGFLAKNWNAYAKQELKKFANQVYEILGENKEVFPLQASRFYQYMVRFDILSAYATIEGIQQVLHGMSRRASFDSKMEKATYELVNFEEDFENEFALFFSEIQDYISTKYTV